MSYFTNTQPKEIVFYNGFYIIQRKHQICHFYCYLNNKQQFINNKNDKTIIKFDTKNKAISFLVHHFKKY
jgi:hypothetical protein